MKSDLIIVYSNIDNSNELSILRSYQVVDVFTDAGPIDPMLIEQSAARFLSEEDLVTDPTHPIFNEMDVLKNFALDCADNCQSSGVRLVTIEQMNQVILNANHISEFLNGLNEVGVRSVSENSKSAKGIWGKIFN